MRLALLGLSLSFAGLPLVTQAEVTRLSISDLSLSAVYARTGEGPDYVTTSSAKNDKVTVTTRVDKVTFRNADLLELMLQQELLPAGQDSTKGWSLVAVWADWESEGASSYRFFARKKIDGEITTVEVPAELLQLQLLAPFVQRNVALRDGEPVSGSELYKSIAAVRLGGVGEPDAPADAAEESEDAPRPIGAGVAYGVIFGPGRYARPAGSSGAIYLPGATSFTGYGISEDDTDVVTLRLRLGKSRSVPASQFSAFINTETAGDSRGPDEGSFSFTSSSASTTTSTGGTLTLGGSGTISGTTTIQGGTLTITAGNTYQGTSATITRGVLNTSGNEVEMAVLK